MFEMWQRMDFFYDFLFVVILTSFYVFFMLLLWVGCLLMFTHSYYSRPSKYNLRSKRNLYKTVHTSKYQINFVSFLFFSFLFFKAWREIMRAVFRVDICHSFPTISVRILLHPLTFFANRDNNMGNAFKGKKNRPVCTWNFLYIFVNLFIF